MNFANERRMGIEMDHFFCYDKDLAIYIHKQGYKSVTTALSPSTHKKFTLFIKSPKLQEIIDQYHERKG
jgi:Domain of unknown function (DUF5659)